MQQSFQRSLELHWEKYQTGFGGFPDLCSDRQTFSFSDTTSATALTFYFDIPQLFPHQVSVFILSLFLTTQRYF